ncbi:hypothetical protein [Mucilaginibacter sp.]|uniref:hypothetical protein n=1 Tax=Mucilaginibacter sp. TaxID=1882438 RepID=UPI0026063F77|nr:hypothetical protein [Mucilaginibacter sp.]
MAAFYFKIGNKLSIIAIPEMRVYMDGHPILTYSYSLYKNTAAEYPPSDILKEEQHLKKQLDPNYLGFITFEIPGKLYNYVADGRQSLSKEEIEQAVEQIVHYRDNPALWKH